MDAEGMEQASPRRGSCLDCKLLQAIQAPQSFQHQRLEYHSPIPATSSSRLAYSAPLGSSPCYILANNQITSRAGPTSHLLFFRRALVDREVLSPGPTTR